MINAGPADRPAREVRPGVDHAGRPRALLRKLRAILAHPPMITVGSGVITVC